MDRRPRGRPRKRYNAGYAQLQSDTRGITEQTTLENTRQTTLQTSGMGAHCSGEEHPSRRRRKLVFVNSRQNLTVLFRLCPGFVLGDDYRLSVLTLKENYTDDKMFSYHVQK